MWLLGSGREFIFSLFFFFFFFFLVLFYFYPTKWLSKSFRICFMLLKLLNCRQNGSPKVLCCWSYQRNTRVCHPPICGVFDLSFLSVLFPFYDGRIRKRNLAWKSGGLPTVFHQWSSSFWPLLTAHIWKVHKTWYAKLD